MVALNYTLGPNIRRINKMTAGTRQYESVISATTSLGGSAAHLDITAASDKLQIVDPQGSSVNLDLRALGVDTDVATTTSLFEVYVQNEADGANEDLIIRDANNGDNVIGMIHTNAGAWFRYCGGKWVSSTGNATT
jgi:hypothetical protein